MSKNLKRMMIGGAGAAAIVGGLLMAAGPASAFDGDNHYSRRHPDGYVYGDPAGDAVAGAGAIAGGAVVGAGNVVAGTVGGVTGDPDYYGPRPGYYGRGPAYRSDGYTRYYRRGAYYYPMAPHGVRPDVDGFRRADGRWDWQSDSRYRRGMMVRGAAPDRGDFQPGPGAEPDDF